MVLYIQLLTTKLNFEINLSFHKVSYEITKNKN